MTYRIIGLDPSPNNKHDETGLANLRQLGKLNHNSTTEFFDEGSDGLVLPP